jgi:hypothetical protein
LRQVATVDIVHQTVFSLCFRHLCCFLLFLSRQIVCKWLVFLSECGSCVSPSCCPVAVSYYYCQRVLVVVLLCHPSLPLHYILGSCASLSPIECGNIGSVQ